MLSWTKRPDSKKENQSKPLEEKIKWSRMNDAKARLCGEFYAEWWMTPTLEYVLSLIILNLHDPCLCFKILY